MSSEPSVVEGDNGNADIAIADFGYILPKSELAEAEIHCLSCTMAPTNNTTWSTAEPPETGQLYFVRCDNPFAADMPKGEVIIGKIVVMAVKSGADWYATPQHKCSGITGWIKLVMPNISLPDSNWKHPIVGDGVNDVVEKVEGKTE